MTGKTPKKEARANLGLVIKFLQVVLYLPIQVAFIPLAMVGLIAAILREVRTSRRLGVSFTAVLALQYRWIMHYFDTRPDSFSVAFTKKFPCESHFGLWSTLGGLIVAQRLFGFTTKLGRVGEPGTETLFSTPGRRVLMFDAIVEKHVDGVAQIVIPGAGFDLVALHFTNGKSVKVFELDQTETLRIKVETLKKANIAHDWITYVPVDYSRESWVEKLVTAGFDKTKKTLFLWQSVSLFLKPDAVKKTLREMAGLCADGSIIAQDFYSRAFVSGQTSRTAKSASKMIERMGEPWRFGLEMSSDPESAIRSFLADCGLRMTRCVQFGKKLDVEPFYCVVEAEKLDSG